MSTRGRKPKPTAQRKLEGNPGHRPLNEQEPQPAPTTAAFEEPPPELAHDVTAVVEWRRMIPILRTCRLITEADRSVCIAACIEWSRYVTLTKEIATKGMLIQAPSGYPMANPYLPIANKAFQNLKALWAELGLTPSSRARLKTDGTTGPQDAFSEFDETLRAAEGGTKH